MLFGFSVKHVIALLLWVLAFIGFAVYTPHDPYYYILFYLFSIPYLLYLLIDGSLILSILMSSMTIACSVKIIKSDLY